MTSLSPRAVLLAASRHRGLLAGGLAAAAVATSLGVLAPAPAATITVLSAVRDLSGGSLLTATDLQPLEVPLEAVPTGVLTAAPHGRLLAGPVRRGEIITDARLVGTGLLRGQPADLRAVSLRIADPATAAVVRPGDHVDVLAAATTEATGLGQPALVVAEDLTVLAVPVLADDSGEGALLVVAVRPETAARLAGAAIAKRLSAVIRPLDSQP